MADYNSTYTGVQIDANLALAATAVQPGDLATVATTGDYDDLTGKPTLGTAAAAATGDFATAAQGALADTAVQPADDAADLGSGAATDGYVLTADGAGGAAWEVASGGGGTPGGSDTQVQFNDGGAFGGDSGFTFDKTNNTLGLGGGTITASDPIIDMAQTWNNGAVAFTAIKANVTDTASAAGSLLMDLQVGGSSRFSVDKNGKALVGDGSSTAAGIAFQGYTDLGFSPISASSLALMSSSGRRLTLGLTGVQVRSAASYSWADAALAGGTSDLILARDAANTLAQRNGVNAQAFNLYNTYTDASNYERGFMRWSANQLNIGTDRLGTGSTRSLVLQTNGATRLTIGPTGTPEFTLAGALYINGQVGIAPVSAGVMRLINYNADGFSTLQLGLATTGFPALKVSTSTLQVRLGNDSAFTNIQGKLTTEANAVSETITATHTITLYDAAGTAYKVPCVAA